VERALVDDRSPNGLPKKPSRDEAGSSTVKVEQSAQRSPIKPPVSIKFVTRGML